MNGECFMPMLEVRKNLLGDAANELLPLLINFYRGNYPLFSPDIIMKVFINNASLGKNVDLQTLPSVRLNYNVKKYRQWRQNL